MDSAQYNGLKQQIKEIIISESPETVDSLVSRIKTKSNYPEDVILSEIIQLYDAKQINLIPPLSEKAGSMQKYITSSFSYWFWLNLFISLITMFSVFLLSESFSMFIFIRYLFGSVFVVFLPGYSFIKLIIPKNTISTVWRLILSIGSSLVLVPMVGLLINYSTLKIDVNSVTMGLFILIMGLSFAALYRGYLNIENINSPV